MTNPIIMHINYCEQGQSLERVFEVATRIGYDGIEFRRQIPSVDQERYLDTIKSLKDKYELPYTLFGGPEIDIASENEDLRTQNLEGYLHFLKLAKDRDLLSTVNVMIGKSINTQVPVDLAHCEDHGYRSRSETEWERAVVTMRAVATAYPEVKFAFETHMFYLHDTAVSAKHLVDSISNFSKTPLTNVGINLDYGNALFFPDRLSLEESITISQDRLFYTHFKSYQPIGKGPGDLLPTSLSDGCINHREYVRLLRKHGFTGPIGIEAPRPGDREHFAKEDYNYIAPIIFEEMQEK